jgi:hypothetical protein
VLASNRRPRISRYLLSLAFIATAGCSTGAPAIAPLPANGASQDAVVSHSSTPAGASLTYAGTFAQTQSHGGTTTLHVTQHVTTSAATIGGRAVVDYHGVQTESGTGAATTTYDAFVAQVPSSTRSGSNVELLKESSSGSGIRETTSYGSGNGVVDQIPEVPQARWTNTATRMQSIANSVQGSSARDSYRADGSYDENAVPVEGLHATMQSYPDGNGVYQFPFQGGSTNSSINLAPPNHGKIDLLFVNATQHITETAILGVWYPAVPPPLASDSFLDAGIVAVPAACGVPAKYGRTATEIVEQSTRLDIVFGEYETTQRTVYVSSAYGMLCMVVSDDLKTYYDYNAFALESKPLTDTTVNETLGLQQAKIPKQAAPAGTGAALPLDVRFTDSRAAAHLAAERAIFHALTRGRSIK